MPSATKAAQVGLAYETLITFQHSPGSGGLRLVPDLALSIPTPTDVSILRGETWRAARDARQPRSAR